MVQALLVAAVLVAVAELGDKTQMLSLLLASRYPARQVFIGVLIAVVGLQFMATTAGTLVGDVLPERLVAWLTAALFVGFGVWSLRDASSGEEEAAAETRTGWGPVAAVAVAFFLAELGDKTQVLTFALAADPGAAARILGSLGIEIEAVAAGGVGAFVGVWLGSIVGMMLVNGLAIWAGSAIGRRLPRRVVARVSGVLFILFGLFALGASYLS